MMFCQKCVTKLVDGRCPRCNPIVEKPPQERESHGSPPAETKSLHELGSYRNALPPTNFPDSGGFSSDEFVPDEFTNFLNFEKMITPAHIRSIYKPVSIAIVIGMLFVMFSGGSAMFFLGLINGAILLILFRIACEILLSLSSIQKKMSEIENKTEAE